jgi:hypothetical protein
VRGRKNLLMPLMTHLAMEDAMIVAKAIEEDTNEEKQNSKDSVEDNKICTELYFELVKQVQSKISSIQDTFWYLGYITAVANPPVFM